MLRPGLPVWRRLLMLCTFGICFAGDTALACNPNEECHTCLIHNPFGGCIQGGNDPLCEARKSACRKLPPEISSPILSPAELINRCISNALNCPKEVINRFPLQIARPLVDAYVNAMERQAQGRWKSLPAAFVKEFGEDYSEVDLNQVRYAENINTGHGQNMTLCYEVFLTGHADFSQRSDLELMLHELTHTVQCVKRGGVDPFLNEYLLHGAGAIIAAGGRFGIHDNINFEQDANSHARDVINRFGWRFVIENSCSHPVRFAINYKNVNGSWETNYWWTFSPGERSALLQGSEYIHSNNGIWYWYAHSTDDDTVWTGNDDYESIGGSTVGFRIKDQSGQVLQNFSARLTCN